MVVNAKRVELRTRAAAEGGREEGTLVKTLKEVVDLYEKEIMPTRRSDAPYYSHRRAMRYLGEGAPFHELTRPALNRMSADLQKRGVPPNTIRVDLARITALQNFIKNYHPHIRLPSTRGKLNRPKATRKIRVLRSTEEERALFSALQGANAPRSARLAAVLLDTGLRVGEAVKLTWDCVYWDEKMLRVYWDKTETTTSVPLTDRALEALNEARASVPQSCPWIFPLEDLSGPMSRQDSTLRGAIEAAGLNDDHLVRRFGKFTPHSFRHTYATRLIRAGVNPVVVQRLMGHSTIQTTMIYVHLFEEDGVDAARAALNALSRQNTESPDTAPNMPHTTNRPGGLGGLQKGGRIGVGTYPIPIPPGTASAGAGTPRTGRPSGSIRRPGWFRAGS